MLSRHSLTRCVCACVPTYLVPGAKGGVLYVQDVAQMLDAADHSAFHAFVEEIRSPDNQPLVTVVGCNASDLPRIRKVGGAAVVRVWRPLSLRALAAGDSGDVAWVQAFPDMRTSFPFKLELPDLSHTDMADLIVRTAKARGFRVDKDVKKQLPRIISDSHTSADARAFNSILAGSVLSKAIQVRGVRWT